MTWQAFLPMGGSGDRFLRAGYTGPKPLIDVDGRTMLAHVLADVAGCERVICGVRASHLATTDIAAEIRKLRPDATIVPVAPHKDGPVRTLLDCAGAIDPALPLLLHYCDFASAWDFAGFRAWCGERGWQAALTGYTGDFPHLGGSTRYAGVRLSGEKVLEIREKHCFSDDLRDGWHSAGSYWTAQARTMLAAAAQMVAGQDRVAGEFFASTALGRLVAAGLPTGLWPLQTFHQWGTPEDLRTWQQWQRGLAQLDRPLPLLDAARPTAQVVLMAGRGQRFVDAGETLPKPFIPVAQKPMVQQVISLLPPAGERVLVLRAEDQPLLGRLQLDDVPLQTVAVAQTTAGQAASALLGLAPLDPASAVLVAPCDSGHVYDAQQWQRLTARDDVDLVIWTAPWHQPARWRPEAYGWAEVCDDGRVAACSVKTPLAHLDLNRQQVLTGQFWAPHVGRFRSQIDALLQSDDRVNGEFYLDTLAKRLVDAGARVFAFPVTLWMSWGTPRELADFRYWNRLFRDDRPLDSGER